jgi:membrane associated rhomboid family serine protease
MHMGLVTGTEGGQSAARRDPICGASLLSAMETEHPTPPGPSAPSALRTTANGQPRATAADTSTTTATGPPMATAADTPTASGTGDAAGVAWVSTALALLLIVVGVLTLGGDPLVHAETLAVGMDGALGWRLVTWWLAHDGIVHLGGNLALLLLFAPAFERYVGTRRVVLTLLAGNAVGLATHVAIHPTRPLLGASAGLYAVAAYSLVVGWHCPFESRRGEVRVWPSQVLTGLLVWEILRWAVDVAASRPPSGAAAHLGGLAAGVLVCGVVHRRLPWRVRRPTAPPRRVRDRAP